MACEDRYDLMGRLHAYNTRKENSTGATDFHGGRALPEYSNVNILFFFV